MPQIVWKALGVAWLGVTLAVLPACSSTDRKPEIRWVGIELTAVDLIEQHFLLKLKARNPNDREIVLETLDFEIELAGQAFAHGRTSQPVRLPGQGEGALDVRASSRLRVLLQQYQAALS